MKIREKIKNNDQQELSTKLTITENELTTLLNTYPPLNDNVQVEIVSQKELGKNTKYCGEWDSSKNKRHGRGILLWTEGDKYLGYWVNDK